MQKTISAQLTTLLALILFSLNIVQSATLLDPVDGNVIESNSQSSAPHKKLRPKTSSILGNTDKARNSRKGHDRVKLTIIKKSQANYLTPENTLSATGSALLKKDLNWYYETFTKETAKYKKSSFEKAGIDPTLIFQVCA